MGREWPDFEADWSVIEVRRLAALSYVASGGFSRRCLYPAGALRAMRFVDRILDRVPGLSATRLLVVLERRTTAE